jgi:hypothetical protein
LCFIAGCGERHERRLDGDAVLGDVCEQLGHGKAFAGAAGEGGERLCQHAGFVGEGEADPALAPVDREQAPGGRHPWAMVE